MRVALVVPQNKIMDKNRMSFLNLEDMHEYKARMRLWSCPDLSLLTVAGMFDDGYQIDYIDLNYTDNITNDYDIAFLSPTTSQINEAYHISSYLRSNNTMIVMGGVHVSVRAEEALRYADTIFIGEAEETFPEFLNDLKNNTVRQVYKAQGLPCLAQSPVPRYDLIRDYPYKSIPIQTSRGCPHQCEFCISSTLYGKKVRRKSIEQVKKEFLSIINIWKNPFIFFTDDNMFIDDTYSYQLLDLLEMLKVRWYAFTDASIAERTNLLKKISKSGCNQLLIGFESLSEDNLKMVNDSQWKKGKRKNYNMIIDTIQSFGIGVVGSFVLGLDADTPSVFSDLYEFIQKSCLYATNITVLTPFPGTRIYERLKAEGRIITEDWSRYNGFELTYKPLNITVEEFDNGFKYIYNMLNSSERMIRVMDNFKHIFNEKYKRITHE
ncbi:B12-binding domain-containing radical SAM protein [Lutispora saccharofermentans]|uniref:B12-binding domain-containing radical SAM protein n=1 Tax=Lutispora saccharofermentans TaxID=3024236 RepID=A0ABT1NIW6_9FIRM|nr:radical SAM protein [Lutispora saccharofermentans]MCQ1531116.1 B12-binding domain-containing radical SAM protein [Lutispora saccharofermentans]